MTTINLEDKVHDLGPIHFLSVEWARPSSRLVRIYYSWRGERQPLALRMDLDKMAILDDVNGRVEPAALQDRVQRIWEIVSAQRTRNHVRASV